ncbi:hypothetical protein ACVWWO_001598 [Bradyrhizobium sp. F1.13.1]
MPNITLDRPDRHRQQSLHGTALDFPRDRKRGEDQHGHGEDGTDQARHDVEARRGGGVVAGVRADLERHLRGISDVEIVLERGLHDHAERADRRARRHWIGGVGRDQQRRLIAAPHRPLEAARDLDAEQNLAGFQEIIETLDVVDFIEEAEIGGVLQRLQDRACEIGILLKQHRARQIVRRGVDGVAEQEQLHHRQHHDHRK